MNKPWLTPEDFKPVNDRLERLRVSLLAVSDDHSTAAQPISLPEINMALRIFHNFVHAVLRSHGSQTRRKSRQRAPLTRSLLSASAKFLEG